MKGRIMDAHIKWIHAFNWWYHSSKKDRIVDNLREGVPLSPKNSKFLAAILEGTAKPLSGKKSGLARFKNSIINNKINDLINRGLTRDKILEDLKKTGLMPDSVAITAVHKRIDRDQINPVRRQAELDIEFNKLYATLTEK